MSPFDVPPPPSIEPAWSGPSESERTGPSRWVLPVAFVLALVAAVVGGTLAFTQRQEVQRLRADLAEAEATIADLEARLAEGEAGGNGLDDLLGELFGGEGGGLEGLLEGGLDGLLEGLLGGGGLDDLLGGAGQLDLGACLPGGGLGGLLGGSDPIVADDLGAQIDAIADRVESLRGLAFRAPVEPEVMGTDAFNTRITELVAEDYPAADADLDRRVLSMLGAVTPTVDLQGLVLDLVGDQAAGFYSSRTGELVVRADDRDAPLGPTGQVILAHELQHAVADQNLGLPVDETAPGPSDAARASLALVEGDATLLMQHFALDALDVMDQLAMATDPSVAASQDQIGDYPQYLQRELVFPYTEGMAFVCDRYAAEGWPGVDAAYDDLPTTTAQVLWPQRYAAGEEAVAVAALGEPGGNWSQARTDTFGAAELLWLFSAPGDDAGAALDDARERAAAWAGGELQLWTDGPKSSVGVALAQRAGEQSLCDSIVAWYTAAFPAARADATSGDEKLAVSGPGQAAVVACTGQAVRLGIAPDLAAARRVAG